MKEKELPKWPEWSPVQQAYVYAVHGMRVRLRGQNQQENAKKQKSVDAEK